MLRPHFLRVEPVCLFPAVLKNILIARAPFRASCGRRITLRCDQLIHKLTDLLFLHAMPRKDLSRHPGVLAAEPQQQMLRPDVRVLHLSRLLLRIFNSILRLFRI